jgi:hypothetical protein
MKWKPLSFAAATVVLACAFQSAPAAAQTYTVTESGTWSSTTPVVTDFSAPGDTWSVSFQVTDTPAKTDANKFTTVISNFVYTLDGTVETAVSTAADGTDATFYDTKKDGGISFKLDIKKYGDVTFLLYGAQAYTGTTSAPTITPGDYTLASGDYVKFTGDDQVPLGGSFGILVPEGGAALLYLLLAAFACCGAVFLKSRAGLRDNHIAPEPRVLSCEA